MQPQVLGGAVSHEGNRMWTCCCCSAYEVADCQCKDFCFKGVGSGVMCMNCFLTQQVNLEYLEGKLEALDGEELMKIKDNINCLFQHCIQALGEEHPIRVVNALQVPLWETGNAVFLLLIRPYICCWYPVPCAHFFATEKWWCLQSSCYLLSVEVPNSHSLFTLGRAIDGFRIQEGLMMEDQVDSHEQTKGIVHIAGCQFGVSKVLRLCSFVFNFCLFSLISAAFFNFHMDQKRNKALEKLVWNLRRKLPQSDTS